MTQQWSQVTEAEVTEGIFGRERKSAYFRLNGLTDPTKEEVVRGEQENTFSR